MIISLIMASGNAGAQSLQRVIRKTVIEPSRVANDIAQDKAEEEAEKQITKAIMEGFGVEENAKFDSQYKFDAWFQMQITEYKKNGAIDEQVVYNNYFNKKSRDYCMEYGEPGTNSAILFDSSAFAMIILTDEEGDKTGFATKMDPETFDDMVEDDIEDNDAYKTLKTGKTKEILGYVCDEYLVEEEGGEAHMWISEKLGKEINKEMLNNATVFGSVFQYSSAVNGMVLEYELIDENGEKTVMQVIDLDLKKTHTFSTEGYSIVSVQL
jgi:hypothetical protein